jgi:hypothetical protein
MDGLIPEHVLLDDIQVEAAHLLEDPQDVGHLRIGVKVHKLAKSSLQILNFHHCKKRLSNFPSPAGMSITKLSLARNNLVIPGQGEFD